MNPLFTHHSGQTLQFNTEIKKKKHPVSGSSVVENMFLVRLIKTDRKAICARRSDQYRTVMCRVISDQTTDLPITWAWCLEAPKCMQQIHYNDTQKEMNDWQNDLLELSEEVIFINL